MGMDIPILTYHKIDIRREWGLNVVSPQAFRAQMEWLKSAGFSPINFRQSATAAARPVIITFDDGYESVYRHAFPILQEFGFTAVVFIITGFRGRFNTWDANLGGIRFRHLNDSQIREMSALGIEMGSHTVSHRALPALGREETLCELLDSRRALSDLTGQPVMSLAYPFGRSNQTVRKLAAECGYRFGCVNLWGTIEKENLFTLRRIPVYQTDSLPAFRRKLGAGWGHRLEMGKLRAISWPARLTPLYQRLKRF